jgi:hypothetical protein
MLKNFKILLEICRTVFSPSVSDFDLMLLESNVYDFLSTFKECYPTERITYKMHCLVHYVRYICQLGPLGQVWCMRYEGKHAYFKSLQKKIGNFTNPAWTLSYRHQISKCQRMISCNGKMLSFQVTFPGKMKQASIFDSFIIQFQPRICRPVTDRMREIFQLQMKWWNDELNCRFTSMTMKNKENNKVQNAINEFW